MTRPDFASSGLTSGILFSTLQAATQAPHPVQRSRSIVIPQRLFFSSAYLATVRSS
jgi:hypothetical protein